MNKNWLLRGVAGVHLLLFFTWSAALKAIGFPDVDFSQSRGIVTFFGIISLVHLVCAIYVLYARRLALIVTVLLSFIYIGLQFYYGFTIFDFFISALLVFSIVVSLKYLLNKKHLPQA